ncbi:uncharacterized protein LOC132730661 [Ruditapes philippinarum]|uniref:uncharacterized protein LOC132730661 n=1 Tax=Ruditapes philippinarum TaxID=129788 RepID=UPI00295B6B08|nr:uncharacterized protein LOC132730661 [Ruditapes philippinarum]
MAKLWLIFLMAAVLSVSEAKLKGGTGCAAYYRRYGNFCYSDTSSVPRPGATIQYLIRVQGPGEICCEALTCTRYSCSMKYIGCGRNNWSSADLQWVGDSLQTPKMRCKTYYRIHITIYYSFKTTH